MPWPPMEEWMAYWWGSDNEALRASRCFRTVEAEKDSQRERPGLLWRDL